MFGTHLLVFGFASLFGGVYLFGVKLVFRLFRGARGFIQNVVIPRRV